MKLRLVLCGLLIFQGALRIVFPGSVEASYDPVETANNKYGIHVADVNELDQVAELVNSSGGDWGYVTVVIQDNDRDLQKWLDVFNQMRRLHLIPIVRLATHGEGEVWVKPKEEAMAEWVGFLSVLNWPIKNRYLVLYNEPNHAREWGNSIDPEGYGDFLVKFAKALKKASEDYFILPAGLDVSAATNDDSLDAAVYLRRLIKGHPEFLDLIDGWTSHAYPNPGFSGSPYASGRGTLKSYQWELDYLRQLGLGRDLPVLITETGWIHNQGQREYSSLLSPDQVAANLQVALDLIWDDPKIIAVTPFIFNYQSYPFDRFSWKVLGAKNYYPQYETYRSVKKIKGAPQQKHRFEFLGKLVPDQLFADTAITLETAVSNDGQSILEPDEDQLAIDGLTNVSYSMPRVEPGQSGSLLISLKTPDRVGKNVYTVKLKGPGKEILLEEGNLELISPPKLSISVPLGIGWGLPARSGKASLQILTTNGQIIQEFNELKINDHRLTTSDLDQVIPGLPYRLAVKIPYYLTQEKEIILTAGENQIPMGRFLPLDLNNDGRVNFADLVAVSKVRPKTILDLLAGRSEI